MDFSLRGLVFEKFREWYDSPVGGTILGSGTRIVDELDAPYDFPEAPPSSDDEGF